ncbi:MAG: hypothetical protein GX751_02585 [Desulfuromonadaceae bacterium]|nr:hypothetical protein [Desulfuromonadaceae bacterium]
MTDQEATTDNGNKDDQQVLDKPCAKCGIQRAGKIAKFYYGGEFEEDDQSELGKIVKRKRVFFRVMASDDIPICDQCLKKYQLTRLIPSALAGLFSLAALVVSAIRFYGTFPDWDPLYLPIMTFFLYGLIHMLFKVVDQLNTPVLRDKMAIEMNKRRLGRQYRYFTQDEHRRFKIKK